MAFKARIAAGAATLALTAGGLAAAGALPASAATPTCGGCSNIRLLKYHNEYPLDVYQGKSSYGQPIILFQQSNSDLAEDFVVKDLGTVGSFYNHNRYLITPAFDQAYSHDEAYEIQYEPNGVNSNFCVGTTPSQVASSGDKVGLYPCGASASIIWAQDTNVNDGTPTGNYYAYIDGATNTFSNPLVLNYPAGNPTDMPRVQLNVQPLSSYSDGTIYDNQLWNGIANGVTPPP